MVDISGTAVVGTVVAKGEQSAGSAAGTNKPVLVAGDDGTNVQTILTHTDGKIRIYDINQALPAGANAIGKLAANADVNIGSVQTLPDALLADELQVSTTAQTDTIAAPGAGKHLRIYGYSVAVSTDGPTITNFRGSLSHNLLGVGIDDTSFVGSNSGVNWGPPGYVALPTNTALTLENFSFSAGSAFIFVSVRYTVNDD